MMSFAFGSALHTNANTITNTNNTNTNTNTYSRRKINANVVSVLTPEQEEIMNTVPSMQQDMQSDIHKAASDQLVIENDIHDLKSRLDRLEERRRKRLGLGLGLGSETSNPAAVAAANLHVS